MNKEELEAILVSYADTLQVLSTKLEDIIDGEVNEASCRLEEVYEGKGADAFFLRWGKVRQNVSSILEYLRLLRLQVNQLQVDLAGNGKHSNE